MTVHRDLDELAAEGLLRKVRGGAMGMQEESAVSDHCLVCHKRPHCHTRVIMQLTHNRQRLACCPHCGLMRLSQNDKDVISVLVTGFLHGRTLAAHTAHYLVQPDITICCTPTILAFERQEDAIRFRTGFGGQIHTLPGALTFLREAMQLKGMGHDACG